MYDAERRTVNFLTQFLAKPNRIGAIAPSSGMLAHAMLEGLDLENAGAVLEYGPGSGAFTKQILKRTGSKTKFVAVELDPDMALSFKCHYPEVVLIEDSVANIRSICDRMGIEFVDYIISGLPWGGFPESVQRELMDATVSVLKPGGQFVTFTYFHMQLFPLAQRFGRFLPKYFSKVSRSQVVWWNLPPAFVYRCTR